MMQEMKMLITIVTHSYYTALQINTFWEFVSFFRGGWNRKSK